MDKIPILILTMDRPIQFKDMINKLMEKTDPLTYKIIICDNGSTHPDMIHLLKKLELNCTVIYNKTNMIFKGFNEGLKLVDTDYFILSDPDILVNDNIPSDWINIMINVLKEANEVPKVGMALDINFNINSQLTQCIKNNEHEFWEKLAPINTTNELCYYGMTDTTLCMYRRDTYSYWDGKTLVFDESHGIVPLNYITQDMYNAKYTKKPIRMAGKFTAKHLGWYTDRKYLQDIEYYKSKSDPIIASTIRHMYDLIRGHHGII